MSTGLAMQRFKDIEIKKKVNLILLTDEIDGSHPSWKKFYFARADDKKVEIKFDPTVVNETVLKQLIQSHKETDDNWVDKKKKDLVIKKRRLLQNTNLRDLYNLLLWEIRTGEDINV